MYCMVYNSCLVCCYELNFLTAWEETLYLSFGTSHNTLLNLVRTKSVIRKGVLDLTTAAAWPTPFKMRGQPAGKQA
jgi:hypothetical protein